MVRVANIRFTHAKLKKLKEDLANGKKPTWGDDLRVKKGKLYLGDRLIVPTEEQEKWIRDRLYNKSLPPISFSRDAGYVSLQKETLGISRRTWFSFLGKQEIHQVERRRPAESKRQGQRLKSRGICEMDLVEAKPKDLQTLGRTKSTYIFTLVSKLTGYLCARELRTKTAKATSKVLGLLLDEMEKALKTKVTRIQSDAGSEFKSDTAALMKQRGIKHVVVRLGPKIEQVNAFLQSKLYNLIRQRRGGTLPKLIAESVSLVNGTPSRITGLSPSDAVDEKDSTLAVKFNQKRQSGGVAKLPKIKVGDTVRILKVKRKADSFFKSYRAGHYTQPYKVERRSGRNYVVGGKSVPRDELLKVPKTDAISRELLEDRAKPKRKAGKAKKKPEPAPLRRSTRIKRKPKQYQS